MSQWALLVQTATDPDPHKNNSTKTQRGEKIQHIRGEIKKPWEINSKTGTPRAHCTAGAEIGEKMVIIKAGEMVETIRPMRNKKVCYNAITVQEKGLIIVQIPMK